MVVVVASRVTQIQNANINVVYDEFVYEEKEHVRNYIMKK